jgi:hypothetical protein
MRISTGAAGCNANEPLSISGRSRGAIGVSPETESARTGMAAGRVAF